VFIYISGVLLIISGITLWLTARARGRDGAGERLSRLEASLSRLDALVREEFGRNREESQRALKENREELSRSFTVLGEQLVQSVTGLSRAQKEQLDGLAKTLDERARSLQEQLARSLAEARAGQEGALKSFEERFTSSVKDFNEVQRQKFDDLAGRQETVRRATEEKLKEIRETVEGRLARLQEDNGKKLEEMRKTVDEKLQESVERRFNDSFKLINERLEAVHKGLGEMQALATGVGDLKKVLTNVKARGTFGEVQLGAILEQVLSPEQYVKNDHPADDRRVVEYAVKLPGKGLDGEPVLLPLDSKFPVEDYQRLLDAYDNNIEAVDGCRRQFEVAVKGCARMIHEKYIKPPRTTDFAILFVPAEGVYAEILRQPGLAERLQQDYRVIVVGPTNLVAFLNSLQMGFRTLAIEKRSSEVWEILGAIKTEFGRFETVLGKTRKKLQEVTNVIEQASTRSRVIVRKLKTVQELPPDQSVATLGESLETGDLEEEPEEE
jgi:DNA recombination protein RmuC